MRIENMKFIQRYEEVVREKIMIETEMEEEEEEQVDEVIKQKNYQLKRLIEAQMNKLELERQYIKSLGEIFGDSTGTENINTIGNGICLLYTSDAADE